MQQTDNVWKVKVESYVLIEAENPADAIREVEAAREATDSTSLADDLLLNAEIIEAVAVE